MGGVAEAKGSWACDARHRDRCHRWLGEVSSTTMRLPYRPEPVDVGGSLRRSLSHGVADAIRWTGCFGAASERRRFLRSPGARHPTASFSASRRFTGVWPLAQTASWRCLNTTHWCDDRTRDRRVGVAVLPFAGQPDKGLAAMAARAGEASAFRPRDHARTAGCRILS